MIAIKNRFGKIGDRFSFRNRSAIFRSKSIPGFHLLIAITIAIEKLIRIDGDLIFVRKSISDLSGKIDP
jgi:hypothetical protein